MEKVVSFSMPVEEFQSLIFDCLNSWQKYNPPINTQQQGQGVLPKHYMTREEAAKLLGISLHTLNKWTKEGKLKGYRIGSRVRYIASEIENSLTAIAV